MLTIRYTFQYAWGRQTSARQPHPRLGRLHHPLYIQNVQKDSDAPRCRLGRAQLDSTIKVHTLSASLHELTSARASRIYSGPLVRDSTSRPIPRTLNSYFVDADVGMAGRLNQPDPPSVRLGGLLDGSHDSTNRITADVSQYNGEANYISAALPLSPHALQR